jgi:hypothetical protein
MEVYIREDLSKKKKEKKKQKKKKKRITRRTYLRKMLMFNAHFCFVCVCVVEKKKN